VVPTSTLMPGQVRRVQLDARHLLPGQELAQRDGHEAAAAAHLALDPRLLLVRQRHDAGEGLERRAHIRRLFRDQQGAPVLLVAGDHPSLPVQHAAARGGEEAGGEAVLLGQRRIALALLHLQLVQAVTEEAEQAELRDAERDGAAREAAAGAFLLPLLARHVVSSARSIMTWRRESTSAKTG
jgi:hypothetical protein